MASKEENKHDDVVSVELPAPDGWVKKCTPSKSGTPHRNEVVFISPTGEEIKSKRRLEQYLKSHPEGPVVSEFDWGTGDAPRRSARLSEKSKATDEPTAQSPKKKQRISGLKKGSEDKVDVDAKDESKEEQDGVGEETKVAAEGTLLDGKDVENKEVIPPEKACVDDEGGKKTDADVGSKETTTETSNDNSKKSHGAEDEETNDAIIQTVDTKIEEFKTVRDGENERPGDVGDMAETYYEDKENSKQAEAAETPDENEHVSEEPTFAS